MAGFGSGSGLTLKHGTAHSITAWILTGDEENLHFISSRVRAELRPRRAKSFFCVKSHMNHVFITCGSICKNNMILCVRVCVCRGEGG